MTARALEELDAGLGSLQAVAVSQRADGSSWSLDLAAEGSLAGGGDVGPKKTEMEPSSQTDPGLGKKLRAAPRSPARRKTQMAPPALPPPPPPPPPREEPPWGSLSLNKCLVVASLLALLGSGFQLCRDAVIGMANAPAPGVPPSSAPKEPEAPAAPVLQETRVPLPPPPAPAAGPEELTDSAGSAEAAEEEGETTETAGLEDPEPSSAPGPKEKRKKVQTPRREETGPKSRRDSGRRKEKPPATREPRKARERDPRPRAYASGDPEPKKHRAWASRHHPDEEDRRSGRKHRAGKGRD